MKLLSIFSVILLFALLSSAYARSLKEIKSAGYIIVATTDAKNKKPVNYIENGKRIGIDVDLMKLVAKELRVTLRTTIHNNLDERITLLTNDKADITISSFSVTQERIDGRKATKNKIALKGIDFSFPYFITGVGVLMHSKFREKIKTFNDLTNQKIGVVKGSTAQKEFKEMFPKIYIVILDSKKIAMEQLKAGKIDGYSTDLSFLDISAKEQPDKYYTLKGEISSDPYGIGIKKNNITLREAINTIIKKIKRNGQLTKILDKYKKSLPTPPSIEAEEYTIKKGDTLAKIAQNIFNDPTQWRVIYELNKEIIPYPNIIQVGLKIKIRKKSDKGKSTNISSSCSPTSISTPSKIVKLDLEDGLKKLRKLLKKELISKKKFDERQNNMLNKHGL